MPRSLPGEIWQIIIRYIPYSGEYRNALAQDNTKGHIEVLYNLCLVSRTLHNIAEPLLYTKFSTRYRLPFQSWAYSVATVPRLTAHVRELALDFDWLQTIADTTYDADQNAFFYRLAREAGWDSAYDAIVPQLNTWMLLFILCRILPNLDRLMICTCELTELQRMIFDATRASSIKELRIDYGGDVSKFSIDDEGGGLELSEFSRVLSVPKLERLHLFAMFACDRWAQDLTPNSSVRHLRLTRMCLDEKEFSQLIALVPRINSLEYHEGFCQVLGSKGSEMLKVLAPVAAQLKSLSLDLSHRRTMSWVEANFMSNFVAFSQLEHLSVDCILIQLERLHSNNPVFPDSDLDDLDLFPDDPYTFDGYIEPEEDDLFKNYFPRSLKSLRVTEVYANLAKSMTELSENVMSWLPNLIEVQIDFAYRLEPAKFYSPLSRVTEPSTILDKLNTRLLEEQNITLSNPPIRAISGLASGPRELSLIKVDDHLRDNVTMKELPQEWQIIANNFNAAGVRVKFGNSVDAPFCADADLARPFEGWIQSQRAAPVVDFENDEQMATFVWR